jgi:hypothetical protein
MRRPETEIAFFVPMVILLAPFAYYAIRPVLALLAA